MELDELVNRPSLSKGAGRVHRGLPVIDLIKFSTQMIRKNSAQVGVIMHQTDAFAPSPVALRIALPQGRMWQSRQWGLTPTSPSPACPLLCEQL